MPLVPFKRKLYVPECDFGKALTVRVEIPDPIMGLRLKEAFVFAGNPETLSCTLPLKPFSAVMVT